MKSIVQIGIFSGVKGTTINNDAGMMLVTVFLTSESESGEQQSRKKNIEWGKIMRMVNTCYPLTIELYPSVPHNFSVLAQSLHAT